DEAQEGLELRVRLAPPARQEGGADSRRGKGLDERGAERGQVEGNGDLLAAREQAEVVRVDRQAVLGLCRGVAERDEAERAVPDVLELRTPRLGELAAEPRDGEREHSVALALSRALGDELLHGAGERFGLAIELRVEPREEARRGARRV